MPQLILTTVKSSVAPYFYVKALDRGFERFISLYLHRISSVRPSLLPQEAHRQLSTFTDHRRYIASKVGTCYCTKRGRRADLTLSNSTSHNLQCKLIMCLCAYLLHRHRTKSNYGIEPSHHQGFKTYSVQESVFLRNRTAFVPHLPTRESHHYEVTHVK